MMQHRSGVGWVLRIGCVAFALALGGVRAGAQAIEWRRFYDGPAHLGDQAKSIALDVSGNLVVTGFSYGGATDYDYASVKYSPAGQKLWSRRYNGPSDTADKAANVATDPNGNVVVTGSSGTDIATVKYDPSGKTVWVRRTPGIAGLHGLAVDGKGNIAVVGAVNNLATSYDFTIIVYGPNGKMLWQQTYDGPAHSLDGANAVAFDHLGNLYVTGEASGTVGYKDYTTLKFDPMGNLLWLRTYDGPGHATDSPKAIAVDTSGNVHITGYSDGGTTGFDFATIKYSTNGKRLWLRRYNGPDDKDDNANKLAVDGDGNVYVTGATYAGTNGRSIIDDLLTLCYDANGNRKWVRRYGPTDGASYSGWDIAVNPLGGVSIVGIYYQLSIGADILTVRYDANGKRLWSRVYDGGSGDDRSSSLAVGSGGDTYVAGSTQTPTNDTDYLTIGYGP